MSPRSISTPDSSPIRFFSPWHHQHLHRSCCCCSAIYELLITSRLLHKAPTSGPPLPGEHVAGVGQHKRRLKTEIRGCRSDGSGSPCRRSSWNCLGDNFLPPSIQPAKHGSRGTNWKRMEYIIVQTRESRCRGFPHTTNDDEGPNL